ncbi:MAG: alpha/beta hydrolase [Nitrospirota bacterium]
MKRLPTPFLVPTHGASWVWDHVRPLLRFPSLAVDLPGHGAKPGDLNSLSYADCVKSIQEELPDQGRFILVGHSLGATVVLALAESLPARIAHLVIIAGPVPRPGRSITDSFPLLIRVASRVVLRSSDPTFPPSPRLAARTMLNGLDRRVVQETCARLTAESRFLVLEPLRWSGRPSVPCTYIRCLRDRSALSPRHQERMARNLGAQVQMFSLGTCHYPMLERPEDIAALLNRVGDAVIVNFA